MSKNKDLFKQAIADAKSVREAALINAKATIEEAFAPKIQEMFDSKISEMDDDYSDDSSVSSDDDLDEDFDLTSILAELDDEDPLMEGEGDDELDEVKDPEEDDDKDETDDKEDDKESKPKSEKPKPPAPKESKPKAEPKEPGNEDDLDVSDLSVDDFKKLITDIIAQQLGGDNDGISLDDHPEDNLDADPTFDSGTPADNFDTGNEPNDDDEDFNIDELLGELDGLDQSDDSDDLDEVKAELNEALKVIKIQENAIREHLLINEKLKGITRLMNKSNLNTSQKAKIIETFDKAKTVSEAKLVYESLKQTLSVNKQVPIKESYFRGSASKPILGTKPAIVNVDAAMARMQKLANIK